MWSHVATPVLWCDEDDDAGEDREGCPEHHKETQGEPRKRMRSPPAYWNHWKWFIITSNIFLSKLRRLPRVIHLYWKSSNISPFYIFLLRMIDYGRKVMHGGEILEPTWVVVPLLSRHRKWKTEWSGQRNKQPGKKRDDLLKMRFRVSPEKELQRWMRSGSTRSRCPLDWPGIDNWTFNLR